MLNFMRKTLLYIVLAPYAIFGLGVASNQLVLIANNDTFPVRVNPVKLGPLESLVVVPPSTAYPHGTTIMDDAHCVMTEYTHLNWLADNFDFGSFGTWSVGDLLLELGEWAMPISLYVWGGAILRKLMHE